MKKIMFFVMALVATTMVSCGYAEKTTENDSTLVDSVDTVMVDSVAVDSVVVK